MKKQSLWLIKVFFIVILSPFVMAENAETETKLEVKQVRHWEHSIAISSFAFSLDSRLLVVATTNNKLIKWDIESGKWLGTLHLKKTISQMVPSPDGKWVAVVKANKVVLWDNVETRHVGKTLKTSCTVNSVQFFHNGKLLALYCSNNIIELWDVNSGKKRHSLDNVVKMALSRDGKWLALVTTSNQGNIDIFKMDSWKWQYTLAHGSQVQLLSFLPNSKSLISSTNHIWKIWNINSWQLQETLNLGTQMNYYYNNYSPNNKWLAFYSSYNNYYHYINLWSVESKQIQHTLNGTSFAFSPNGKWLALGNNSIVKLFALKPPVGSETTISKDNNELLKPTTQISEEKITPSEPLCESSVSSKTSINNSRPLKTVMTAYSTQKKAHQKQLKKLREIQENLSDLQKQIENNQTDIANNKNVFETNKIQFYQCYKFDFTGNSSCSTEQQQQAYSAFYQTGAAYQNSLKIFNKHKQELEEVKKLLPQEQKKLKSETAKLEDLGFELKENFFQKIIVMEEAEMFQVLEVITNTKDSKAKE